MNHTRFAGSLYCLILAFLLMSCGGNGNEKTADSTAADTTAMPPPPPPKASTIVTTPENILVVTQKVANYSKWKLSYDGHDSARLSHGIHNYVICRGLMDSNMVMVALKIDDTAKANAFVKDPSLRMAMKKGGVMGMPTIRFVTETWQDTVSIETNLRAQTSFMVKDWDAWQKAFVENRQERMDNGITDRVISHDMDNDKKVGLITAITDTAKAFAYYKSDGLKKKMEAGGVVGKPTRFLFRIVQWY